MKNLNYHNIWHNKIKNDFRASFVGFESHNSNFILKVIVNKNVIECPLQGMPSDITMQSYNELYNALKVRLYGEV